MAIPDYQSVMLPLLRHAADGQEHSVREAIEELADQFQLTDEERKKLLPSGRQATFDNRVEEATTRRLLDRRNQDRVVPAGRVAAAEPGLKAPASSRSFRGVCADRGWGR